MENWIRSKKVYVLLLLSVIMLLPGSKVFADSNLLGNSGFEQVGSGIPKIWSQDIWVTDQGASKLWIDDRQSHSGSSSAAIENVQPNHARWIQKVTVKPNTYYKISGWIKTEGLPQSSGSRRAGANLFISGVSAEYPQVYDTKGAWQKLEFTGITGPEQTTLVVAAGLGQYGALIKGKAYFDDITVEQTVKPASQNPVISMDTAKKETKWDTPVSFTSTVLMIGLFSIFFAYMYKVFMRRNAFRKLRTQYMPGLVIFLLAALAVRAWIALKVPGYTGDLKTFIYWGNRLREVGFGSFYEKGVFADYPPGYMYVLYVLSAVKAMLSLGDSSAAARLLFKLPGILADLGAGMLLFQLGRKKIGAHLAFALALIYLFNPAVWINSAAWGQIDAFFVLFLLLFLHSLTRNQFERSSVWFALAVLIKPQALIFTPVLLLYFIYRKAWKRMLISACCGVITLALVSMPFFWRNGGAAGLIQLYGDTLSSYPYATLNAFNLFALAGGNWKPLDQPWLFFSFRTWGIIFIVLSVVAAVLFSFGKGRKGEKNEPAYFLALVLIVCVYVFGPKMHERYMFPALLLCLFSYIQFKDRRLLHLFFGLSLTQYMNVDYVLKAYSTLHSAPPIDGVAIVCGIANLALLVYMLAIGIDILFNGRIQPLPVVSDDDRRAAQEQVLRGLVQSPDKPKVRMRRNDWIWMGAITLLYAALALYHLGGMKSPETYWKSSTAGESFYVDLGSVKQLERVNLFDGPGRGKVKIQFSNTPDNWDHETELDLYGKVFKWNTALSLIEARYVKFTAQSPDMYLHEIAIYERGSKTPLKVAAIYPSGIFSGDTDSPDLLFDEPLTDAYRPSFMNSSYFDEIYHPRTAYEYLQGMVAYENTHPPLGKIFISVGIKLLGLSPFSWRIVGTLFGIAMLPLMYRMALTLFKRSRYAITATLLFALDFMHFSQTRMATIDVYAVFFMMLMYYFMFRYVSMNFYKVPLIRTLVPLGLSGLFFGIGVASKWNVAYGGAGLAVMLGLSLYARYREFRAARAWSGNAAPLNRVDSNLTETAALGPDSEQMADAIAGPNTASREKEALACTKATRSFLRNTLITLSSCLIFFIAIPAIIYCLSFIPVLNEEAGGYTLDHLIEAQVHMYDYHSQLTATHPYSSQWWEWPFMKRPLWLYNGTELPSGMKSTMVTMGNPLIWWTGIFAVLLTVWLSIKRKDQYMYMAWIAYFSVYVPWMLVPRYTFIYHYFTMVPFMILSIVYVMKLCEERYAWFPKVRIAYVIGAGVLFVMFYPALSGLVVSRDYIDYVLRWFPSWDY
ncbi:glycosyltransferase family 39 protein [Paenibacillus caui]|uniref:glycosyltransferase family 39 protein n=1 Tax=Paenibacillus caui TaxID=2873927 RepID=UPI001CA8C034|nr:glycosyltransferase family 39 protein [Paenibacillus caui]